MKQKDLILIVIVVFMSVVVSLVISKSLIVPPKNRQQEVEVVQAVSSDFPQPDKAYFNSNSFDPTKIITIGQGGNSDPFSSSKQ